MITDNRGSDIFTLIVYGLTNFIMVYKILADLKVEAWV
jgi:hypothetical protein